MPLSTVLQNYISDEATKASARSAIIQGINDLGSSNDSLASQLIAAQGQVTNLQQQLAAVNLDDASAQAKVLALTQQLQAAQQQVSTLLAQLAQSSPTVFDKLQYRTWTVAGGTVANTPGSVATANFTQWNPGPGGLLAGATISPLASYADKYRFLQLGADFTRMRFKQEVSLLFPMLADVNNCQAHETDLQQCDAPQSAGGSGLCFDWGTQLDFAEGLWRVWNRNVGSWVPTGTLLKRPAPNTWLNLELNFHRDAANVYYDDLMINGIVQPNTAIQFPAPVKNLAAMINFALQMDSEKIVPDDYTVYVDNVKYTAWAA